MQRPLGTYYIYMQIAQKRSHERIMYIKRLWITPPVLIYAIVVNFQPYVFGDSVGVADSRTVNLQ